MNEKFPNFCERDNNFVFVVVSSRNDSLFGRVVLINVTFKKKLNKKASLNMIEKILIVLNLF